MNLATDTGMLNLAGVLLFAERPELIEPQFVVKAIRYPGTHIHATDYIDTEDFAGPLPRIFQDTLAFIMRNLHKIQAGRSVNAPGVPEIPVTVFEELVVNALVHRDYLVSAAIRVFVFDNRIEIISPGHLPDNLTVDKIRAGNSNIRNPILVSYVAKGLLPYHGLGSGIQRALAAWSQIDFIDDREGSLFTARVHRKPVDTPESVNLIAESSSKSPAISSPKTEEQLLGSMRGNPAITAEAMGQALGITKRTVLKRIAKLKAQGRLRRIGPAKGGRWEVLQ
jgi:ATP-dependent DNA helicase RecG